MKRKRVSTIASSTLVNAIKNDDYETVDLICSLPLDIEIDDKQAIRSFLKKRQVTTTPKYRRITLRLLENKSTRKLMNFIEEVSIWTLKDDALVVQKLFEYGMELYGFSKSYLPFFLNWAIMAESFDIIYMLVDEKRYITPHNFHIHEHFIRKMSPTMILTFQSLGFSNLPKYCNWNWTLSKFPYFPTRLQKNLLLIAMWLKRLNAPKVCKDVRRLILQFYLKAEIPY